MKKIILIITMAVFTNMFVSGQQCIPNFDWANTNYGSIFFYGFFIDSTNNPTDTITSYMWTVNGGGATYTSQIQTPSFTFALNTPYDVCLSITTSSGCSGTFCDTVMINNCNFMLTGLDIQPTQGLCNGSSTIEEAYGTEPYTYVWNTGETTPTISNLCSGDYYGTITDYNGCVGFYSSHLNDTSTTNNCTANFSYVTSPNGVVDFYDNSFTSDSSASITQWTWTISGGGQIYTSSNQNFLGVQLTNQHYYNICLNIQTSTPCNTVHCDTIIWTNNPCLIYPVITTTSDNSGTCNGTATVTTTGGTAPYAYIWSNGATSNFIGNLCAGAYSVTVTDANGCTAADNAYVALDTTGGLPCNVYFTYNDLGNGQVQFNAISDSTNTFVAWNWTFSGGIPSTSTLQNPYVTFNTNNPVYVCLTATTNLGVTCTNCDTIILNWNNPCNMTVNITTTPDDGTNNGRATANVIGGTPPYSYLWNNGAVGQTIIGLNAGFLSCVTVTDNNNCTATQCANILLDTTGNSPCNTTFTYTDLGSGQVQFNAISDSTNTFVSWNWTFTGGTPSTSTTQNPYVVFNANYPVNVCLTATTNMGITCTICDSIILNWNNPCTFTVDMDITPVSVINGNDGAIDLTVTGGTPPYYFIWSTGANTEDVSGLSSGTYTVQVLDSNLACTQGQTFTAYIYEPYDTTNGNTIVDTLNVPVIDTCLTFVPDSFYISQINVINNSTVVVTWIFQNNGVTETLDVEYTYTTTGNQLVILTLNCDNSKALSTYASYIHISSSLGVQENLANSFSLYPNPTQHQFSITAKSPYTMQLSDLSGRIIMNVTEVKTSANYSVENLPEGIYLIRLTQGNYSSTQKLVIVK